MSTNNDYERFAVTLIQTVLDSGNYKPTEALVVKIGAMLESGPFITTWPRDVAEAAQRARDRAHALAQRRPELPRLAPLVPPVVLPRLAPLVPRPILKVTP